MEKSRLEMAELWRRQINRFYMEIGSEISKKLKRKADEMGIITHANRILEIKIKNLAMEAQFWRNLAQSNEAEANILRANLEEVLASKREEIINQSIVDEAESCCSGGENEEEKVPTKITVCRYCGEKASSVLILPCRHLCLCDSCGVDTMVVLCPVCGGDRNGVFKVNLV
jgi:E3 ubiquitin-protein ligase BOI and related proteins